MTNAGETSGALSDGLPAAHPEPPQLTKEIPDRGRIPLDRLGDIDQPPLSRLLPSGRKPSISSFNSSI